jgi:hypothetical protein
MKAVVISAILLAGLLTPFAVNFFGANIFLYLGSSERKLVIAASQGVCHLALTTESHDFDSIEASFSGYGALPEHKQIVKIGPIDLFSEQRVDPMYWFRFDISRGNENYDYSAIEFPWLLLPILPLAVLGLIITRRGK